MRKVMKVWVVQVMQVMQVVDLFGCDNISSRLCHSSLRCRLSKVCVCIKFHVIVIDYWYTKVVKILVFYQCGDIFIKSFEKIIHRMFEMLHLLTFWSLFSANNN